MGPLMWILHSLKKLCRYGPLFDLYIERYTEKICHLSVGLNLPTLRYLINRSLAKDSSLMWELRLLKSYYFSCLNFSLYHPSFEGLFTFFCKSWKMDKLSEDLMVTYCDSRKGGVLPTLRGMAKKESRMLLLPLPPTCWEIPRESTTPSATQSYHIWNGDIFSPLWTLDLRLVDVKHWRLWLLLGSEVNNCHRIDQLCPVLPLIEEQAAPPHSKEDKVFNVPGARGRDYGHAVTAR